MVERWPPDLPQDFIAASFRYEPREQVHRFATERGERRRRKYDSPAVFFEGDVLLSPEQWAAFKTFYMDALDNGGGGFFLPSPIAPTISESTVRFRQPPSRRREGANWRVKMSFYVDAREQDLGVADTIGLGLGLGLPEGIGVLTPFHVPIGLALPRPTGFTNAQPQVLHIGLRPGRAVASVEGLVDALQIALGLGKPGNDGTLTPNEVIAVEIAAGMARGEYRHLRPEDIAAQIALAKPLGEVALEPHELVAALELAGLGLEYRNLRPETLAAALSLDARAHTRAHGVALGVTLGLPGLALEYRNLRPEPFAVALTLAKPTGEVELEARALGIAVGLPAYAVEYRNIRPEDAAAEIALAKPTGEVALEPHALGIALALPGIDLEYRNARPEDAAAEVSLGQPGQDGEAKPEALAPTLAIGKARAEYRHLRPGAIESEIVLAKPTGEVEAEARALGIDLGIDARMPTDAHGRALGVGLALPMPEAVEPEDDFLEWPGQTMRLAWPGEAEVDWPGVA